eukprot:s1727_g11.t1
MLLRVVPTQLRNHLQLAMEEDADYSKIREKVISWERTASSWSSQAVYRELDIKKDDRNDEVVPMEIDRVKGKAKGKQKGKSKSAGKDSKGEGKWKDGKTKSKDKGKGKDYGYGKGDAGRGKGKGSLPPDTCKPCGQKGHWGRECPVRSLRQVAEGSPSGGQSVASGSGPSTTAPMTSPSTTVRRITYFNMDDEDIIAEPFVRMIQDADVYDMTYSDSDDDWCLCGPGRGGDGGNAYFENYLDLTEGTSGKMVGIGGSRPPTSKGAFRAVGAKGAHGEEINVILDSGADLSVLPLSFGEVGTPLDKKSVLRDAQGRKMQGGNLRQALVVIKDDMDNTMCLQETFALSNVSDPFLALGKMVKLGWRLEGGDQVKLAYKDFTKALDIRQNSLVMMAQIRKVNGDKVPRNDLHIRQVTMTFEGHMQNLVITPGWHLSLDRRTPFLVVVNSVHYKDSYPQVNRINFPYRSTVILKNRIWEVVEVAEKAQHEREIDECCGELTTVVTFFHHKMEDINAVGTINTGFDDPFLMPKLDEKARKDEVEMEKQGFGWHGRSLEDGVYEVEDDESAEEIETDGVKYTSGTPLSKLREALKLCGIARGEGKADAWKRLVHYHKHYSDNLAVELAQREFDRRKLMEGGDSVRGQSIPRMPTKTERQLHELSHWPCEPWCDHCVAARAKGDPHRAAGAEREEGHSEFPVVSLDYCFTRGLKEPEELDKEDLRLYGGDVRVPGKSKSHVKFLAEQLIRFIAERRFSTCTFKADGEPAMRLLLEVTQKARQRLGFRTMVEFSGPGDSQANGRVEREIQTVRGLARTLVRRLREGAKIEINPAGPLFAWAMRHAGWLISHFRRQSGSPTAYEMVTGRKYMDKLAIYGERVLGRLPTANGEDKFKVGIWLGKTDRADFRIIATIEVDPYDQTYAGAI